MDDYDDGDGGAADGLDEYDPAQDALPDDVIDDDRCELSDDEEDEEEAEGAEGVEGAEGTDGAEGAEGTEGDEVKGETDSLSGEDNTRDEKGEKSKSSRATQRPRAPPSLLEVSNSHRKVIIVPDDERITTNILLRPEMAAAIARRAKQIEQSPVVFIPIGDMTDSVEIAEAELHQGKCPLKLRRQIGITENGDLICEEWKIREMTIPALF